MCSVLLPSDKVFFSEQGRKKTKQKKNKMHKWKSDEKVL